MHVGGFAGPVDPVTGMVASIADLDQVVHEHVVDPFDQTNLNLDHACFRDRVPTSENLLMEIAGRLEANWPGPAKLTKARLQETGKNFFEYRYS